jgi:nucleoside-diphosphate-sugar epimerase
MSDRPTVLLLGGTGRTGLCALEQLTQRGVRVRAIVRDGKKIPPHLREHASVQLIEASLLSLSAEELESHVRAADAVVSCLGHVLSVRGIFGAPRDLVTQAMQRVTAAIRSVGASRPTRVVLMTSVSVNRPDHLDTRRGGLERALLALLRALVPPARDNQRAAEVLLELGPSDPRIEWVVIRPDSLIEGETRPYTLHEGLVDSLFSPGQTTMQNIGAFIAELVTEEATWASWRGKLPVIVDRRAPELAASASASTGTA